jgi:hypothetical protein
MKKQLSILLCVFILQAGYGQEQWSMFSKVTASWCSNCGSWGWTMFEEGLDAMENQNVLSWTLHYSGDLRNPTAEALVDNFSANGQPVFFINNDNMSVNSGNINQKIAELEETVTLLNAFAPFAAVEVTAAYDGYKIYGDAQVEYMDDSPGNYYVSHYLIKDHIISPQTNQGSMADHRFVLMDHFGDEVFGNLIASPQADAGDVFDETFSKELEIADEDVADYYVATVLWNQISNGSYRVFNLDVTQVQNLPSNVVDESILEQFNLSLNNKTLNVVPTTNESYTVEILSVDGKLVEKQTSNQAMSINLDQINNSIFIARIISDNKQASQRFFIK